MHMRLYMDTRQRLIRTYKHMSVGTQFKETGGVGSYFFIQHMYEYVHTTHRQLIDVIANTQNPTYKAET